MLAEDGNRALAAALRPTPVRVQTPPQRVAALLADYRRVASAGGPGAGAAQIRVAQLEEDLRAAAATAVAAARPMLVHDHTGPAGHRQSPIPAPERNTA